MVESVRRERDRRKRWLREGEPSVARFVGQIGILGWMIVTPSLIGLFVGRWLDHRFHTGVFFSAPFAHARHRTGLLVGLAMDAQAMIRRSIPTTMTLAAERRGRAGDRLRRWPRSFPSAVADDAAACSSAGR